MAPERDHSGGDADLDAAFAEIIAGWDTETTDPVPRWPASEDTDTPAPPRDQPPGASSMEQIRYVRDHGLPTPEPTTTQPPDRTGDRADDGASDRADDGARPVAPTPGPRDWELAEAGDDHYQPPEPPPLPRTDLFTGLAWAGVLLGPVFLLCAGLFWRDTSRLWLGLAALAFIAGFAVLVLRLPPTRDDGDDDGAVV
ncbi:hypothetical protein [Angustibacter sp. Root456]|uniref:hypothetical protein n=1 Tax=Angustibacter sp. Root456 TaxID=1736539 RepID=UPI00070127E3|nr:hypothetical protein [Angustibacter sp. Root456]KQX64429.1 hypothetical protein ASD06_09645 [Angustibacter sp. Root456]